MTNVTYERIEQFRDIETIGQYRDRMAAGEAESDFLVAANKNGRDNARTPMQWDATDGAGFSQGQPWIDVNSNYVDVNVESDRMNPDGIFQFYQSLIALKRNNVTIQKGRYVPLEIEHPQIFAYSRQLGEHQVIVVANFSDQAARVETPAGLHKANDTLLANMDVPAMFADECVLEPFQAFAIIAGFDLCADAAGLTV
ncbi:MAG: alpha-glucosidase C-terminal domain-containing protein [Granulosicoccus sp.]